MLPRIQQSYWMQFLAVALAYYGAGKVGTLATLLPTPASPVFPAAGIALAAILLGGYRLWPAVAVGALLFNTGWLLEVQGTNASIAVPIVVGGATIQALAGAWLVKRLGAYPSLFEKIRDINILILMGGPVSCLVSCSVATGVFYFLGTAPLEGYLFSWFAWWVGDSIGVMLVAVPILIYFRMKSGQSEQRHWIVPAAFFVLFISVAGFFNFVSDVRRLEAENSFQLEVAERKQLIEQSIFTIDEVLLAVEGLYYASDEVTRADFDIFSRHMFSDNKAVQAVEWVPRVRLADKGAMEARTVKQDYAAFEIIEFDASGEAVPVAERPEYFPVHFIVPLEGNEKALGFDLGSNASRFEALKRARDTGDRVATAPITLVQETGHQKGFLLFHPIYLTGAPTATVEERQENLRGFALGVFRVEELITQAFASAEHHHNIDVYIQDIAASEAESLIFGNLQAKSDWFNAVETVTVGGREWQITFIPKDKYFTEYLARNLWQLLAGGMVFTTLCALLILIVTGRNSHMHQLVKERTDELFQTRRYIDGISENAPGLLSYIGSDLRYKFVNKSYERWFGLSTQDFIGRHMREGISDSRWKVAEPYIAATLKGEAVSFEMTIPFKYRGGKYVHVTYTPDFAEDGTVKGFFVAVEDLSDIKSSEEQLRESNEILTEQKLELIEAKDKAEEATKMKSEFLAVMSHEIRTPMNGIMGTTDLLLETALSAKQRKYADTTKKSAEALLNLINDILDFSKIEAGKLDLECVPFDMQHLVEDVVDIVTPKCGEEGLELLLRYPPDAARYVEGDPGRVRQILLNLLSNAIKFTEEGHVLVDVRSMRSGKDHFEFKVRVEDTGIGIAAEKQRQIFNKFDQADQSTTRKYGGTGLGLSICKKLAELMDGKIGLESAVGHGSTFWFTIRLKNDENDKSAANVRPDQLLTGAKVLIVDDNEIARKILSEQLRLLEADVTAVELGKHALKELTVAAQSDETDPYDIAVIDFRMPEMDGEALARAIKAEESILDTELVLVTSSPARGDGKAMKDVGFTGYLAKPTRPSDVGRVLRFVWQMKQKGEAYPHLVTRHSVQEAQVATRERPKLAGTHILLAEDNPVNQMVATAILKKYGCTVMPAGDGKEAVAFAKEHAFDLIIMDCQMPEMDGFAATQAIRRHEAKKKNGRLPIIAFTANAMKGDKERCLEAGMDDYVSKPVDQLELEKTLVKWLPDKLQP